MSCLVKKIGRTEREILYTEEQARKAYEDLAYRRPGENINTTSRDILNTSVGDSSYKWIDLIDSREELDALIDLPPESPEFLWQDPS